MVHKSNASILPSRAAGRRGFRTAPSWCSWHNDFLHDCCLARPGTAIVQRNRCATAAAAAPSNGAAAANGAFDRSSADAPGGSVCGSALSWRRGGRRTARGGSSRPSCSQARPQKPRRLSSLPQGSLARRRDFAEWLPGRSASCRDVRSARHAQVSRHPSPPRSAPRPACRLPREAASRHHSVESCPRSACFQQALRRTVWCRLAPQRCRGAGERARAQHAHRTCDAKA